MKSSDSTSSTATRFMGGLATFVNRGAYGIVVASVVLFVLAACQAWMHLSYSGDRSQVLSSDAPYYRWL